MNRKIKFRAWDEGNEIMHFDFQFFTSGDDGNDWICFSSDKEPRDTKTVQHGIAFINPYFRQQFKIMQSTGLLDKNGKEIYEGDIIKLAKGTIRSIFAVPGGFAFECLDGDVGKYGKIQCCPFEPMGDEQNIGYIRTQTEVIGNIYENPELLVGV